MANYATLKAAIQQVVKTNGNNEITGALLQQSLLAMVNSLGANYNFAGVAIPSTNPGTPDQNVFYLADAGTYPNFGGTVVPTNHIGVFAYNGTWTYTTLGGSSNPTRANGILVNFYQNKQVQLVSDDLNNYYESNVFRVAAGTTHAPDSTGGWIVEVCVAPWQSGTRYTAVQRAYNVNDPSVQYFRVCEKTSSAANWGNWFAIPSTTDVNNSVKVVAQSLTNEQKQQARTNIEAASAAAETSINKFVTGEYIGTGSINNINTPGGYNIGASVTDVPAAGGYLFVVASNSRFIQKYYFSGGHLYYGVLDKNTTTMWIQWVQINKEPLQSSGTSTTDIMSQKAVTDYVDNPNRPYVTTGSVNSLNKTGGYYVTDGVTDLPVYSGAGGSLIVTPTFNNGRFVHKKFTTQIGGDIYEQIADTNNPNSPIVPWTLTNPRANIGTFGKNIVCFGDSIFGNYDATSGEGEGVVSFMHRYGYANTFNCAFGGTTASLRNNASQYWDPLCFASLVDAIISGDWSTQDYAMEHSTEFPQNFPVHLATLKSIDWANVNIITVAYGANDFSQNKALGTNQLDKTTYTGALMYGISKLQQQYPHIKVVVLSPTWRWYKDSSGYYDHDSDTEENTLGLKITDYVGACLNLAETLHIPGCDNYYKLGINQYNYTAYFNVGASADGAHHKLFGRQTLAHRIVAFINSNV